MLNSALVEHFHAAHRQQQTGSLHAGGDEGVVRFCMLMGDLIAFDLGREKELLLADKFLEYHKIDADTHATLLDLHRGGQPSVVEWLRDQRLVADPEVAQITQAMVEDSLVEVFGKPTPEIAFIVDENVETYDFERSALRLKIGAEVLLRTVSSRVADRDAVLKDFGGWDAVFALAESTTASQSLGEGERTVLNLVDGRSSVDDIARGIRDSSLTAARILRSLAAKGVVRRVQGLNSKVRPATSIAQPAVTEAAPAEIEIYRTPKPAGNRMFTVFLVVMLVVIALVGLMVMQNKERVSALSDQSGRVQEMLASRDWAGSATAIDELEKQAGNDILAAADVKKLRDQRERRLAEEAKDITALIADLDFEAARVRAQALPPGPDADALRHQLGDQQAAFRRDSAELLARVEADLARNDARAALDHVATRPARIASDALAAIDRWRIVNLEQAYSRGANLGKRMTHLERLKGADPNPRQLEKIAQIEADLNVQQERITTQIAALAQRIEQGAIDETLTELIRLRLPEQVEGTAHEQSLARLRTRAAQVRAELISARDAALQSLAGGPGRDLTAAQTVIDQAITRYAQAPEVASLREIGWLMADMSTIAADRSGGQQIMALEQLIDRGGLDAQLVAAVRVRIDALKAVDESAAHTLQSARRLANEGDVDAAEKVLVDLIARPEWQASPARGEAQGDLAGVRAKVAKRKALRGQLEDAMQAGDVDKANVLAREMALKYLPLQVDSSPRGAEVWRDGAAIGRTPLTLNLPATERSDALFEIRLPGHLPMTISGAKAEAGWSLMAHLQRAPVAAIDLGQALTARPAAVEDRAWLASRTLAVAIDAAGRIERFPLDQGGAFNQPIYASPAKGDDGVYLSTREQVAVRLGKTIERLPLSGRTDLPIAIHRSPVVVDRRFLIIAGSDRAMHAIDDRNPTVQWHGETGVDAFAAQPVVVGDQVLAVRVGGRVECIQADDGKSVGRADLGRPVLAAWPSPGGLAGLTAEEIWSWDGRTLERKELPTAIVAGGQGVIMTGNSRVWVANGEQWDDLGIVNGQLSAAPIAWEGHAVLPLGRTLAVVGKRPFRVDATGDFLPATVVSGNLVAAAQSGQVWVYSP